jgi:hypothetical protein
VDFFNTTDKIKYGKLAHRISTSSFVGFAILATYHTKSDMFKTMIVVVQPLGSSSSFEAHVKVFCLFMREK